MTSKKETPENEKQPTTDPKLEAVQPAQEASVERVESPELAIPWFANKVEQLMNEAYQQSQPDVQPEHHQKFASWCNHLGDLWREVKQHA